MCWLCGLVSVEVMFSGSINVEAMVVGASQGQSYGVGSLFNDDVLVLGPVSVEMLYVKCQKPSKVVFRHNNYPSCT